MKDPKNEEDAKNFSEASSKLEHFMFKLIQEGKLDYFQLKAILTNWVGLLLIREGHDPESARCFFNWFITTNWDRLKQIMEVRGQNEDN